ncbi:3-dehydroquinate synthase [Raoultibacter phocaeensis]|uniref:3-dehydroquinate synthase n=1 Tax=Raoultibacter phocaeensis TaxID=2479841 RepID=UPI00111B5C59|nr:3-dehydroquinate synthase [Raoultibacter phocaeensis]
MAIARIVVNIADAPSYDVRVGTDIVESIGGYLREVNSSDTALIVTDGHVGPLYLDSVKASLAEAGYRTLDITVPAGEDSKSLAVAGEIWSAMANLKLSRDVLVVALGGGVVGDLAGFIAATYMRGVAFAQVPTSLLAMVDSSVGGKTGINLDQGKNLVGSFKQPVCVCADTSVLSTLSEREWACGCAEIAKSAVIDSDEFFFWLTDAAPLLAARDENTAAEAIARSVVFKANVVAEDETESKGVRECLNYGHTLGHAIEALAGFGTFSHGEAVAEGMRFAARLGVACSSTPTDVVAAQDELLDELGLPSLAFSAEPEAVLDAMKGDKKVRGGQVRFVLPRDIGRWEVAEIDDAILLEHLGAWARSKEV